MQEEKKCHSPGQGENGKSEEKQNRSGCSGYFDMSSFCHLGITST
jgi:hypothetical protein